MEGEWLVHGRHFEEDDRGHKDWYTNIERVVPVDEGPDELEKLRRAAGGEERPPKTDKTRKKDKREEEKSPKRPKDTGGEEDEDEDRGKKPLAAIFRGTGLDPDAKQRGKFMRRARKLGKSKKKKKKKKSDSSGTTSSSSSGSSSASPGGGSNLFSSEKNVKQLWRRFPGALAAHSLREARERLLTISGSA